MLNKLKRHRWALTLVIELLYVFVYILIAKTAKILNESGYISNAMSLIWITIFIFVLFRLFFRIFKGFKQVILEEIYFEQGVDLETNIDLKNKVHFSDFSDELQQFILDNYTFCMNRMTHEFYLVPLREIRGMIIRVDNSPDENDIFEKTLYTYIDCRDTEEIKEFCMRNPQVLSFVTVAGDIKPDVMIIRLDNIENIEKLKKIMSETNIDNKAEKESNVDVETCENVDNLDEVENKVKKEESE